MKRYRIEPQKTPCLSIPDRPLRRQEGDGSGAASQSLIGGYVCWMSTITGARRSGATLSEALVALMVMAIGVISLASLFPIAVLKTARANQLTVGTDIYKNARELMELHPEISDPGGVSGPYMFDPLGAVLVPAPNGTIGFISRVSGTFGTSVAAAESICAGTDTWTILHEDSITSLNATLTGLQMDSLQGSSSVSVGPVANNTMRISIFYNGGKSSISRPITAIQAGNSPTWSEDLNGNSMLDAGEDLNGNSALDIRALPALAAGISYESARLEQRVRRYSWVATTGNGQSSPSVAVFFGRAFTAEDERVYGVQPGAPAPAITNLLAGSSIVWTTPQNKKSFDLTWPSGETPVLKKGGFLLDARNGLWYQIENFIDPGPTGTTTTITLSRNVDYQFDLVVFPRGVVDVF